MVTPAISPDDFRAGMLILRQRSNLIQRETKMVKCHTMAEVRSEIDRIDRALVKLLAERLTYIEQAGHIKPDRNAVRDDARIEDVVEKVVKAAEPEGLPRAIAEPLWRLLIEKSIEHEFTVFDAKSKKSA